MLIAAQTTWPDVAAGVLPILAFAFVIYVANR